MNNVVMTADNDKLIYLFSLTGNVPLFVNSGLEGDLLFLEIDGLYAAVKYVLESDYSEENIKKIYQMLHGWMQMSGSISD